MCDRGLLGHLLIIQTYNSSDNSLCEITVSVKLGPVSQTSSPGVDGGNRVGGRLLAPLVLSVVAGDGAVSGLGLNGLAIGANLIT